MSGVAGNIKTFSVKSMEKWRVMLGIGNLEFGEIEIRHGILISILDTNIYLLQFLFYH